MAHKVIIPLPAASGLLTGLSGCLQTHSTRETTGASAAVYELYDGDNANGLLLLTVGLAAAESTRDNWYRCVLPFRQGLYFNLVSGTLKGAVSVLLDHDCQVYWAQVLQGL